jgi:Flp pilus assembly protein TadG
MKRFSQTLVRLVRESRGQEIAEAALVLPLMFMVLLGIFWFGQAFRIYGTLTQAARQGARAAAAPSCTTCAAGNSLDQNADNAVHAVLNAARLDNAQLAQPTTTPVLNSCTTNTAVPCDGGATDICVQPNVQLSNVATGTEVCGVSVSMQYPYQFWFPGTPMNMKLIQLQGLARVRMETQ